MSIHLAFCGLRDRWRTLWVEGAIIGTKRRGGGHQAEIYGVFTFFLIHCPANTAINAAARRAHKSVPAMRNVLLIVKQRQESPGMSYVRQHSISAVAHPQPDSHTYFFCVVIRRLKGTVHPRFKCRPPTTLPACYWLMLDPLTFTQPHPHNSSGVSHSERIQANGCVLWPWIPTQLNNG